MGGPLYPRSKLFEFKFGVLNFAPWVHPSSVGDFFYPTTMHVQVRNRSSKLLDQQLFFFEIVMLTIPDLTSRVESSQQGTKPESSRVEESTPEK